MESIREYRIITNNPLAMRCIPGAYLLDYREGASHRDILVQVRDLVYGGHRLYTHPLAGSVKPNETPYRSVVVSREPRGMEADEALLIASALESYDKFPVRKIELTERILRDFQLIDYTLLCGALGLDALAGLSNKEF